MTHQPVMLTEALECLSIKKNGIYLDATFGRGGHSQAILSQLDEQGRLYACDQDIEAVQYAQKNISDTRFHIIHANFSQLKATAAQFDLQGKIDGILLDLGVSSPQLDTATRGFSFQQDGPLDMRMDQTSGRTAAEWLQYAESREIAEVLWKFGEEKFSRKIADKICETRKLTPITRTKQLVDIILEAIPFKDKFKHPATRSFQAIRLFVNQELNALESCLTQCLDVLAVGGRLVVISFHSLEDRIVKRFMRVHAKGDDFPIELPIRACELKPKLRLIGGIHKATATETQQNPRARSAVMRSAEKLL